MALTAANCTAALENCTDAGIFYEFTSEDAWAQWNAIADYIGYQPWIFSLIGSAMVGLSGVLPLLVIPIDEGVDLKNGASAATLKILLSFAVGGLLGDVFLHLLPEAWASKALNIVHTDGDRPMACGLWVLSGFLVFIIAEKLFIGDSNDTNDTDFPEITESTNNNDHKESENNNCPTLSNVANVKKNLQTKSRSSKLKNGIVNGLICVNTREIDLTCDEKIDGRWMKKNARTNVLTKRSTTNVATILKSDELASTSNDKTTVERSSLVKKLNLGEKPKVKHISGYLNLMANCIDNFTHGLAVGGSFLVSFRLGALTTFAILIHEIPHEVGDFAILLKSGFSRWDAARAQLFTASGGIVGALVAVLCSGSGVESRTSWILPFTAGGFLHIGMVTVLPELLKESNPMESVKQLGALLIGIIVMAILTIFCD